MAVDRIKALVRERRYRERHRDQLRVRVNAYNAAHKQERLAWQRAHPERAAARHRARLYGLTSEMFAEYLDAQEGACAYCGNELPQDTSKIAVDHDHVTGEFRGLLHILCNGSLGFAEMHFEGYMAAAGKGVALGCS